MLEEFLLIVDECDRAKALNVGATQRDIERAEQGVGAEFPDQLKRLYTEANGESGALLASRFSLQQLFGSFEFLNLERVVRDHKMHADGYREYFGDLYCYPEGYIKNTFFNKKWIPFAKSGNAIYIAIDMDPGPRGFVGQVIMYGADALPLYCLLAPDLASFMASLIDYLHRCLPERNSYINIQEEYSENDGDFLNAAYEFYEEEKWRNYSIEDYRRLLIEGKLPFWHGLEDK